MCLGVPAGTALGQAFGWRFAFWALVPIGVIAGLGLLRMVPHQAAEKMHLKHEFHAVLRPQVQLVLALSTLSSVSLFCVFTYIAPDPGAGDAPLAGRGDQGACGLRRGHYGGQPAWRQTGGLEADAGAPGGACAVDCDLPGHALCWSSRVVPAVIMVFVWGCIHFAAGSPLQARIVEQAKGAPNLASTLNQGAFNLGNALGASLGGIMLTEGIGYRYLSWGSAAVASVALLVALIALRVERIENEKRCRLRDETAWRQRGRFRTALGFAPIPGPRAGPCFARFSGLDAASDSPRIDGATSSRDLKPRRLVRLNRQTKLGPRQNRRIG